MTTTEYRVHVADVTSSDIFQENQLMLFVTAVAHGDERSLHHSLVNSKWTSKSMCEASDETSKGAINVVG